MSGCKLRRYEVHVLSSGYRWLAKLLTNNTAPGATRAIGAIMPPAPAAETVDKAQATVVQSSMELRDAIAVVYRQTGTA